ncbi:MAG: peptidoglycan recognition family protein [Desulfosporosinus sp.]
MYPVYEQLIKYNRSGKKLLPQGVVVHATATPGATAQNEHDYFNSGDRQASAHYFVDPTSIIRCIPENEQAWHSGPTANGKFLSVEMCEVGPFIEVWKRTVWLVADACVRYGWQTGPNVWSHRGIAEMNHETDHLDPHEFLEKNGKNWGELIKAIDAEIKILKAIAAATIQPVKKSIATDDIYLSVRVREGKAEDLIAKIKAMGFACQRLDLA